jgi:hypothetical protein
LELAKQVGTVAQACPVRGDRRERASRVRELSDRGGEAALPERSRREPPFIGARRGERERGERGPWRKRRGGHGGPRLRERSGGARARQRAGGACGSAMRGGTSASDCGP